jgi:sulfatase maturation enzyme AslB (radical SAM superfamily)
VIATAAAVAGAPCLASVQAVLTSACNLRCDYCYQRQHPARRMRWETLQAAIELLAESGAPEVKLGFYGGEPLLEQGLLRRAVEAAWDRLRNPTRTLRLVVTTNGTLLEPGLAAFLEQYRVEVTLSYDGPGGQVLRRGASANRLEEVVFDLRRRCPALFAARLSVAVTVTAANLRSLADTVGHFLDQGLRRIAVRPRLTPDAWTEGHEAELECQVARVAEASRRWYERTGEVPVDVLRRTATPPSPRSAGHCGGGRARDLAVDVDGRLTACVLFATSYGALPATPLGARLRALEIGHVGDRDLEARRAAYPAQAAATGLFDPLPTRSSRCRACAHGADCQLCPAAVAAIPGNEDPHAVPALPCAWHRVVSRERQRFPVQPLLADILTRRARPIPVATRASR